MATIETGYRDHTETHHYSHVIAPGDAIQLGRDTMAAQLIAFLNRFNPGDGVSIARITQVIHAIRRGEDV